MASSAQDAHASSFSSGDEAATKLARGSGCKNDWRDESHPAKVDNDNVELWSSHWEGCEEIAWQCRRSFFKTGEVVRGTKRK